MSIPGSIENGSIDTEFTPILRAIDGKYCAADERFSSVNEAIGLLQYGQQQTDDLADQRHNDHERRIHSATEQLRGLEIRHADDHRRIEWLENVVHRLLNTEEAQPIPQISRWPAAAAHPPEAERPGTFTPTQDIAEWLAGNAYHGQPVDATPHAPGTERYAEYLDQGIHSSIGDPHVHVPQALWHSIREELKDLRELKTKHPPEGDWAHIPAAEWESICEELEALRAKWNSVPWDDIQKFLWHMPNAVTIAPYKRIDQWRAANAPKEAAE